MSARSPGLGPQVGQELDHRALAVGAGDADHGQLVRRVTLDQAGGRAHGGPHIGHDQLGHGEVEGPLAQEGAGPGLDGAGGEVVAVVALAPGTQQKSQPAATARESWVANGEQGLSPGDGPSPSAPPSVAPTASATREIGALISAQPPPSAIGIGVGVGRHGSHPGSSAW